MKWYAKKYPSPFGPSLSNRPLEPYFMLLEIMGEQPAINASAYISITNYAPCALTIIAANAV